MVNSSYNYDKSNFCFQVDKIIQSNRLSHAYIIQVNNYEKDFLFVKIFVKSILCKQKKKISDSLNCKECNICSLIDNNNYPDLYIVEPDGKDIKKGQLIGLQKEFQNKSLLDNKRIYIIKEADKLNESAANAILKFLEEPNDNIVAILVTTNRYKMLETILSRCQVLSVDFEKDDLVYSDELLELIDYIVSGDSLFINYSIIVDKILCDKVIAAKMFDDVNRLFITYLSNKNDLILSKYLSKLSDDDIVSYISIIEEYLKKIEFNVNYKLWLDSLFARLLGGE